MKTFRLMPFQRAALEGVRMYASEAVLTVPDRLIAATLLGLGCLIPVAYAGSSAVPAASSAAPAASAAAATPDVRTVAWQFTGQTGRPGCRVERVAQMCSRFAPEPVDIAHINVLRRQGVGTRLVSVTPSTPGCVIVRAELGRDHASNLPLGVRCFGAAAYLEVAVGFTHRVDVPSAAASALPATGTK